MLKYLQLGCMTLSLFVNQWMHFIIGLQDFANEWSFELLFHIDLYKDHDEKVDAFQEISRCSFGIDFFLLNGGRKLSLKWKSTKRDVKASPIKGSKYLMIDEESKST